MIQQKIERIEQLNKQIIEEFKDLLILVEKKQEEYLDKIKTTKSYISDFTFGGVEIVSKKVSKKVSRSGRPKGSLKYTKEHLGFLKEVSHLSDTEIVEEFNKKFGTNIKPNSRRLYNLMLREKIPFQREATYKERKESKYDIGIKHFSKDKKYLCNQAVIVSNEKLTNDWDGVTCDNCKRIRKREKQPKIYTKERVDFLRENYENSDLSREELTNLFNEKFNLDVSTTAISASLKDNKIKKAKGVKKKSGSPKIYTQKIIDFMILCASKGMNRIQAREECQKEFEMPFNRNTFKQVSLKNNIGFVRSNLPFVGDIPENVQDFIKKNLEKDIYVLKDDIIEKFNLNYSIKRINSVILRFKADIDPKESEEAEVKRIKQIQKEERLEIGTNEDPFVDFE
jgi:hypothetical protein